MTPTTRKAAHIDPAARLDRDIPHDASEDLSTNPSANMPFAELVAQGLSRRGVMGGTLAGAAMGFLAPQVVGGETAEASGLRERGYGPRRARVGFEPLSIADATADATLPSLASEYAYQPLIPWGTPITPGACAAYEGDPDRRPTSEQAALQVGIGHDGMWFFPGEVSGKGWGGPRGWSARSRFSDRGMLAVNHEFGRTPHVLGKDAPESLEEVRVMQHVHGVSVVALSRRGARWEVVDSPHARRIHVNSEVAFSGPAANSPLLQNPNGNAPQGTVNNCGSGPTPWGTYLTCEENFNGYFGSSRGEAFVPSEEQKRYGFTATGFGYGWHVFDRRFDLSDTDYSNEHNRFGWIVEIDPFDGTQTPVKRTAMGRFKHEAVAIAESASGRIAAYMGDDQRFDYCYKYVSDLPWKRAIADGESPLDRGALFVARFDADGTGEWLELTIADPLLAARFADQAELLVNTRIAADLVGATPMDRPEWTTVGTSGEVFWTLTNNSRREMADAANPQAPNPDGHIIRTRDADDHLGTTFTWDIYILASDTAGTENSFTDPDAAYADGDGRLFIGTDGEQPDGLQDQLLVFDTTQEVPAPKRLLAGVAGDEITGFTTTPDRRWAFVNIQHPGNGDPSATSFPRAFDGRTVPRDATLVIHRKDFGIVGS